MKSLTKTITFGRKNERSIEVSVNVPETIEEWISALNEEGVERVLRSFGEQEIETEAKRIMSRNPDLTSEEANKHFQTIFQFGADMAVVERVARLKTELANLGAK